MSRGTTDRKVRVDDELWEAYGAACEAAGTNRSEHLRAHMRRTVAKSPPTRGRQSSENVTEAEEQ